MLYINFCLSSETVVIPINLFDSVEGSQPLNTQGLEEPF